MIYKYYKLYIMYKYIIHCMNMTYKYYIYISTYIAEMINNLKINLTMCLVLS